MIERSAGVLLHITSLAGKYGIGTLGKEAYDFVDFLKLAKITYWQVLPIYHSALGNSPYSVYSTFAGNPLFIDLDDLIAQKLLRDEDLKNIKWGNQDNTIDYDIVNKYKTKLLHQAFNNFDLNNKEFLIFIKNEEEWLIPYAKFMTLSECFKGLEWHDWPKEYFDIDGRKTCALLAQNKKSLQYYIFIQFIFYQQWYKLKNYANVSGVRIIGDIPIYVAYNSADVYTNKELFDLNEDGKLENVAGCPPDSYAENGQKWGNPLYRWDVHKKSDYYWWTKRIKHSLALHDVLRIDHFRGFDAYFAIPFISEAKDGKWLKGPGIDFFNIIKKRLGDIELIAEDLGYMTASLKTLLQATNYPGMKVLQFAFDSKGDMNSDYLPHNINENSVAYIGTHDNDTLLGWYKNACRDDIAYAMEYLGADNLDNFIKLIFKALWMSKASLAVVTAQDILKLDSDARMNVPSIPSGNWAWKLKEDDLNDALAKKIAQQMDLYGRSNNKKKRDFEVNLM